MGAPCGDAHGGDKEAAPPMHGPAAFLQKCRAGPNARLHPLRRADEGLEVLRALAACPSCLPQLAEHAIPVLTRVRGRGALPFAARRARQRR